MASHPGRSGVTLVNKATGQALTVTRDGAVQLAPVESSTAEPGTAGHGAGQQWALTTTAFINPAGAYTIANLNSALNLGTPGGASAPGTIADQENPDGAADQAWRLAPTGTGLFTVATRAAGCSSA